MPANPRIDLDSYDGSDPAESSGPEILILGSPHFTQASCDFAPAQYEEVAESLARFEPDLVAVEYLPPNWPAGSGRDYRPEFELGRFAEEWDLPPEEAATIVAGDPDTHDECRRARAYFLVRDYVNAGYRWSRFECAELDDYPAISEWWSDFRHSEHARLGYPIAAESGTGEIVSFDDQSEEGRWFIHELAPKALLRGRFGQLWQLLPTVNRRSRELRGFGELHDESLSQLLNALNSPEQIARQYWAYEHSMPAIEIEDGGQRQLENYWLRNERMFERIRTAVEDRDADRALVITGVGHKYFLDELAREHGYRWIDPRDYLPEPE